MTVYVTYQVKAALPDIELVECVDMPQRDCAQLIKDGGGKDKYCTVNCTTGVNVLSKAWCCKSCAVALGFFDTSTSAWSKFTMINI